MEKFKIHFEEDKLEELRKKIEEARLPKTTIKNKNYNLGVESDYLQPLLEYWCNGYDWYAKENELNQYPQYTCEIDDLTIHFFHIRSNKEKAMPLLLTHGWPDSFLRYAKLFPLLSDYDLIVPSLPGFAFSTLPEKGFMNNAETAEIWHKLMTEVLGYKEYVASGGDMGRGVTTFLATNYPNEVKGIHLTDVGLVKEIITQEDEKLTPDEIDYKNKAKKWLQMEGVYINIHSTKPQTLAYLLSDSPLGMAAWITEKYHDWSEFNLLSKDDILDSLTLYWMTNTACTSIYAYHGNTFTLPPQKKIEVPTAISAFPYDVLPAPREWIEKNYPIIMYKKMQHGGHFTALEQPKEFAESISQFINEIIKMNEKGIEDVER